MANHDGEDAINEKAQLEARQDWVTYTSLLKAADLHYETANLFYCFLIRCWHYLPLIAFSFPLVIIPLHVCSEKLKMRQITEKELIVNE